jgi:hypothetical protein
LIIRAYQKCNIAAGDLIVTGSMLLSPKKQTGLVAMSPRTPCAPDSARALKATAALFLMSYVWYVGGGSWNFLPKLVHGRVGDLFHVFCVATGLRLVRRFFLSLEIGGENGG